MSRGRAVDLLTPALLGRFITIYEDAEAPTPSITGELLGITATRQEEPMDSPPITTIRLGAFAREIEVPIDIYAVLEVCT